MCVRSAPSRSRLWQAVLAVLALTSGFARAADDEFRSWTIEGEAVREVAKLQGFLGTEEHGVLGSSKEVLLRRKEPKDGRLFLFTDYGRLSGEDCKYIQERHQRAKEKITAVVTEAFSSYHPLRPHDGSIDDKQAAAWKALNGMVLRDEEVVLAWREANRQVERLRKSPLTECPYHSARLRMLEQVLKLRLRAITRFDSASMDSLVIIASLVAEQAEVRDYDALIAIVQQLHDVCSSSADGKKASADGSKPSADGDHRDIAGLVALRLKSYLQMMKSLKELDERQQNQVDKAKDGFVSVTLRNASAQAVQYSYGAPRGNGLNPNGKTHELPKNSSRQKQGEPTRLTFWDNVKWRTIYLLNHGECVFSLEKSPASDNQVWTATFTPRRTAKSQKEPRVEKQSGEPRVEPAAGLLAGAISARGATRVLLASFLAAPEQSKAKYLEPPGNILNPDNHTQWVNKRKQLDGLLARQTPDDYDTCTPATCDKWGLGQDLLSRVEFAAALANLAVTGASTAQTQDGKTANPDDLEKFLEAFKYFHDDVAKTNIQELQRLLEEKYRQRDKYLKAWGPERRKVYGLDRLDLTTPDGAKACLGKLSGLKATEEQKKELTVICKASLLDEANASLTLHLQLMTDLPIQAQSARDLIAGLRSSVPGLGELGENVEAMKENIKGIIRTNEDQDEAISAIGGRVDVLEGKVERLKSPAASAQFAEGLHDFYQGRCAEAAVHFESAIRLNPTDAGFFYFAAFAQAGTAQTELATDYLKQAIQTDLQYPIADWHGLMSRLQGEMRIRIDLLRKQYRAGVPVPIDRRFWDGWKCPAPDPGSSNRFSYYGPFGFGGPFIRCEPCTPNANPRRRGAL